MEASTAIADEECGTKNIDISGLGEQEQHRIRALSRILHAPGMNLDTCADEIDRIRGEKPGRPPKVFVHYVQMIEKLFPPGTLSRALQSLRARREKERKQALNLRMKENLPQRKAVQQQLTFNRIAEEQNLISRMEPGEPDWTVASMDATLFDVSTYLEDKMKLRPVWLHCPKLDRLTRRLTETIIEKTQPSCRQLAKQVKDAREYEGREFLYPSAVAHDYRGTIHRVDSAVTGLDAFLKRKSSIRSIAKSLDAGHDCPSFICERIDAYLRQFNDIHLRIMIRHQDALTSTHCRAQEKTERYSTNIDWDDDD